MWWHILRENEKQVLKMKNNNFNLQNSLNIANLKRYYMYLVISMKLKCHTNCNWLVFHNTNKMDKEKNSFDIWICIYGYKRKHLLIKSFLLHSGHIILKSFVTKEFTALLWKYIEFRLGIQNLVHCIQETCWHGTFVNVRLHTTIHKSTVFTKCSRLNGVFKSAVN